MIVRACIINQTEYNYFKVLEIIMIVVSEGRCKLSEGASLIKLVI